VGLQIIRRELSAAIVFYRAHPEDMRRVLSID